MAGRTSGAGALGTELEHAIGFNSGMPNGVHCLPPTVPVPGVTADPRNERYIVSAGACAVINSMADPHEQVFMRGHKGTISAMVLSPTGRLLATGETGFDSDILVWEVSTGRILLRFQEHDHGVSALAFSDDERLLFCAGADDDGWMNILDLATGGVVWKHQHEPKPLVCASFGGFSKDVKGRETALYQFVTGGSKGLVLWALHPVGGECSGVRIGRQVANSLARDYVCMAWSPYADKAWLYAGTASGDIVIVHVKSKDVFHSVAACGGGVTAIAAVKDYVGSGHARFLPPRSTRDYGGGEAVSPESVNALIVAGGGDGSVSVWGHALSTVDSDAILCAPVSGVGLEALAAGRPTLAGRTFSLLRTVRLDGPVWALAPLTATMSGRANALALLAGTASGTLHRIYASDNVGAFAGLTTGGPPSISTSALIRSGGALSNGVGAVAANPGGLAAAVCRQSHACSGDGFDPSKATSVALSAKPGTASLPAPLVSSSAICSVTDVAFAPELNDKVATIGTDNTVRVWDMADYDCTSIVHVRSVGHPNTIVFATDFTLTGWEDGAVRVYFADPHNFDAVTRVGRTGGGTDGGDGGFLWAIPGAHAAAQGGVSALALATNRRFCVSGGGDGKLRVWDMRSREMVSGFTEHSGAVTGVAVYKDDAHFVSASADKSFMCWDLRKEKRISAHTQRAGGINAIAISRDQSLVLTVGKEKRLQLWDLRESSPVQSFGPVHGADGQGLCVASAHSKDVVATGGTDGVVRVWDLRMGKPVSECIGHSGVVNKVAWSPDDRQLASVGSDGCLMMWNVFL